MPSSPVTLDTFRRNAYRILGLPAGATQAQIESAARLMRLMSADAPPSPTDARWLGPVARSTSDVEHALMRLTDPESRIAERLWWYTGVPPVTDAAPPMPSNLSPRN